MGAMRFNGLLRISPTSGVLVRPKLCLGETEGLASKDRREILGTDNATGFSRFSINFEFLDTRAPSDLSFWLYRILQLAVP
jgi:hypothetical protein